MEIDVEVRSAASEFSQKTFETFVVRLAAQAFTILMGVVVARALGPAGKGVFAYAITVLALLVTLSGGASAAISRQYGRLKRPSGVVYTGMMRFFVVVCIPIAAMLALAGLLTHAPALIAAAAAFPFAYMNQVSLAFSLADGQVRWSNVQGLLIAIAMVVVLAILCYALRLGVTAALIGWIAVYAVMSVYSVVKIAGYARDFGTREERSQVFREQTRFGFRVTFNQLLALLNYRIDIFIVLYLLGDASLGIYSVAIGMGQTLWNLSRPLAVTSYGRVTSGTPEEATRITVLCVRHALFTVGLASLLLFALGPLVVQLVYGAAFAPAGRALQWLLPGIVAYCVVPFFGQYFTLHLGKPGISTIVIATSTIVCGAFTFLLAPRIGIVAGAMGTSLSYVCALAICMAIFCRHTGVRFTQFVALEKADLRPYRVLMRSLFSSI
jgi:O-antigen/teichoic acid export membrane protein